MIKGHKIGVNPKFLFSMYKRFRFTGWYT